jgi:hypothetical protein
MRFVSSEYNSKDNSKTDWPPMYSDSSSEFQLACIDSSLAPDSVIYSDGFNDPTEDPFRVGFGQIVDINSAYNVPTCYPMTIPLHLAVLSTYSQNNCERADTTLRFLSWLLFDEDVNSVMELVGNTQISQLPRFLNGLNKTLNLISCLGSSDPILSLLPYNWKLSPSIRGFGYSFATLGIICLSITSAFLAKFHKHVIFRSASVPFLITSKVGLALMFSSVFFLAATPSSGTCTAWVW